MTFDTLILTAPQIVIDKLESLKTLRERPDYHPENNCWEHVKIVTNRLIKTGNSDLIMAGIFHDIFKKETARINPKNGYPTSPGHDKAAADWIMSNTEVQQFIQSNGANFKRVSEICGQHMRIKSYDEMNEKKKKAYRLTETFSDLLIFSMADDMLTEFIYPYSQFFPTLKHKNIYIALNSQRQIDWEKSLTYIHPTTGKATPTLQALNPRSYVEAVEISIRQIKYDQEKGKLRYSIEEMFRYDMAELNAIQSGIHQEWVEKFKSI
jgi:hypothetical protein